MLDSKALYRKSSQAERIITDLRVEMYIHLEKYNYISFNSQLAGALTSMMRASMRIRKWASGIKDMPYALSESELSVIRSLVLGNSLAGVGQKANISKLSQHTDYRGDTNALLEKMREFVVLQDDIMDLITQSSAEDETT